MDLAELLQSVPLFSVFSPSELGALEKALSVTKHPDGYSLIHEGKKAHAMHLIVEGTVRVTRRKSDGPGYDVDKTVGRGDIVGLVSMFDHGPSTASCVTSGEVVVASLPRTAFDLLLHNNSPISEHFKSVVANRLAKDMGTENEVMVDLIERNDREAIRNIAKSHREIK